MKEPECFLDRVIAILRRKSLLIALLLLGGEAAVWLSGKGSLVNGLLFALLVLVVSAAAATVRAARDGPPE